MGMKTATKTANVCVTIHKGKFDINFDCVGVEVCRFALCSFMPPDGTEECGYCEHGSCRLLRAKYTALEHLKNRLTRELKQLKEEYED